MKAIVIHQPYATLIATGKKTVELRSRRTSHRGPLAVIAGMTVDVIACRRHGLDPDALPTRSMVGIVDVADVQPVTPQAIAAALVPDAKTYNARHAWLLANPRPVTPKYVRGKPGIFDI